MTFVNLVFRIVIHKSWLLRKIFKDALNSFVAPEFRGNSGRGTSIEMTDNFTAVTCPLPVNKVVVFFMSLSSLLLSAELIYCNIKKLFVPRNSLKSMDRSNGNTDMRPLLINKHRNIERSTVRMLTIIDNDCSNLFLTIGQNV